MQILVDKFRELPDYRKCKQLKFNVGELLFLSLLATLSGANGYKDITIWIKSKRKELRKFLNKPFIVPTANTIRNVFLNIDKDKLDKLFQDWSHNMIDKDLESLTIVSTDGKTMRGSHNKIRDVKARHIVSLFATKQKITLAQKEVDGKSNEIPALLELLDSLKLKNCVITMDAMHTQKNSKQDLRQAA
jgi:hypothetical protein